MIARLLELLDRPRSLGELGASLETSPSVVEGMLRLLEARGYVGRVGDPLQGCRTGCGACSVRRLCPGSGQAEAPEDWWVLLPERRPAARPG